VAVRRPAACRAAREPADLAAHPAASHPAPRPTPQDWTAERSVQLGLAVSGMLKGYTTTAASIITAMLKSVTRFTMQVGAEAGFVSTFAGAQRVPLP
jgi:hypothetical protein